jgi:hypothetical protein
LWISRSYRIEVIRRFFSLIFVNDELIDYLQTNFLLINEHNFSLSEIEDMMPYERQIYIMLLLAHLDKKAKKNQ